MNVLKFFPAVIVLFLSACLPHEGTASDAQQSPGAFLFSTIYFLLLAFFAYYYIVIRPSQLEEDEKKKFIEELKKNDEVCVSGGIVGRLIQKKDRYAIIEISPKVEIKVLLSEISKKPSPAETVSKNVSGDTSTSNRSKNN